MEQVTAARTPVFADLRIRTGVDLVSVSDVAESVSRFGSRYLTRVFTDHELSSCWGTPTVVAQGLAARFAAKEAAMKVLRPSGQAMDWRYVEVRRDHAGACTLRLTGEADRLATQARVVDISVALSHEGSLAGAVVVALCENTGPDVGEE
ncbi:MAG: 4'-phosphopantetheinyl transferase superfamily protein [Actinomycetota bacterium]|nr:4'-phosphopantetheinyl transferase superfamily protein [Actinomycetota bacterium]